MPKPDILPSRGAIAEPLLLEVTRDLTPEDMLRLGDAPKVGVPILQKLRAIHHRQALLLAQGKTPTEVALIVGCTVQRLVQLQQDPTFTELMHYYKDQMMVNALEDGTRLQAKIVDVGEMAVDELQDRLADDQRRRNLPIGEVRKIAEFAMDRTVAPPKVAATQTQPPATITLNFGTSLRDVSDEPKTIEGQAEPLPSDRRERGAVSLSGLPEPSASPQPSPDLSRTGGPTILPSAAPKSDPAEDLDKTKGGDSS
jgi:hypothetical protein